MKFYVFADLHGDLEALARIKQKIIQENIDLVVCAGDFTLFGMHTEEILQEINNLPAKVLLFHGNHEYKPQVLEAIKDLKNIIWFDKLLYEYQGFKFLGFSSDGFNYHEPDFVELVKKPEHKKIDVLVFHQPPFNTKLDIIWSGKHVGCKDFTAYIKKYQPTLVLAGHIHECNYEQDMIGNSLLVNPGPEGRIIEMDAPQKEE